MELVLEEVGRQLVLVLKENLGSALAEIQAEMDAKDQAFYERLGVPYVATILPEPVEYFLGHAPTFLERPVTLFPAVSVMAHTSSQDAENSGDNFEGVNNDTYIEAFLVSPDIAEINRMSWRYAKAIHRVLSQHPTLDGFVVSIDATPSAVVSNADRRRREDGSDEVWFIQGVRVDVTYVQRQPW